MTDTDDALTVALATDLDAAFPTLVRAHQDRLYTIARRMVTDPGAAEEVTQDALVRAYRALAGYERERIRDLRLRPWLATIVLNRCRSRLARRGSAVAAASLDIEDGRPELPSTDPGASPSAAAERGAERERWARLLDELPATYRAAVVLRHVDGLSYPELAAALERPEGTVKAQVHRGLALLRRAYEADLRLERQELTA